MTKKLPKRGLPPMHPGQLLREEILPALNRPRTEIAELLGISRQTLCELLEEKRPVTPMMALPLGKLCGNGPDLCYSARHGCRLSAPHELVGYGARAHKCMQCA